jgi:hypothetical protein
VASFNKFNQFAEDVCNGAHDWDADTFKIMLTNTAPVATNTIKANLTEISAGNGYTAGGTAMTISSSSHSSGTQKVVAADVVFTASGGAIAQFRYAVLYNDTTTSPADPLVCWWDYGSAVDLADGESFTVDADPTDGIFTIA